MRRHRALSSAAFLMFLATLIGHAHGGSGDGERVNASVQRATGSPKPEAAPKSNDYTVGKDTQRVTPREMKETIRPDGSRSIVTGQTRGKGGKIEGSHSHSVVRDGKVEYSRTREGRIIGGNLPKSETGGAGAGGGGGERRSPKGGGNPPNKE